MGTWDIGPFDNDQALDTVAALSDGSFRMAQFRFECGRGALGTDEAETVLALAAVLNGYVPSEEYNAALSFPFTRDDRQWIRRRADHAVNPDISELYDLWQDAGELENWLAEARKYSGKFVS
ncbi:DUF4259 domain-containing protein [Corynebacterium sp. MSK041]|uniref:DUF4259 domain-containing protein n=1 Tax=Corynebacterium sp. MSK041 TaxID=3050194 RepID=UPI002549F5D0|nr:DUF4259 domain-containing protein [Corynebacterium sp. MSK041]MDK8794646.1 DUF4259 domain-containing protein [Corynebacterium sp. MSK041]